MPQISMADCVPVLKEKIEKLAGFVADYSSKDGTHDQAFPDAGWLRAFEVLEQLYNVAGPPPELVRSKINELLAKRAA